MKPNFIVKSFIEKNTYSTIKDSFNYLEKHLPNSKQPATLPYHISAFTNNQTLLDKPSSLSTLRASTPSSSNNASTQNINLEGDLNNERSLKETKNYQKKALSSSGDKVCSRAKNSKQNLNFLQNSANEDEYNQINSAGSVNSLQPQLVPIQTFSFFKWKINVDTLVRIFIIAMICLMVINAMLYYKLRRIETLADGLRNDPTILEKISAIKNSCGSGQFSKPGHFNDQTLSNDLIGWRDVISNTLNVIQKMENSLKEWDKSLEKRQYLDRDYIPTKTNSINLNDQNSVKDDHSGQSKVDDL